MTDLRVLFLGDSFVAGAGDSEALGWVGRVAAAARAEGLPLTPYNLGVRRETSEQVVARLERKARPRIAADTRLVLSFGANDATLEEDRVRVAPDGSVAALEAALGPWLAEVRAGDGAHPGAGGYTQLAAVVRAPFLAWLRSARL